MKSPVSFLTFSPPGLAHRHGGWSRFRQIIRLTGVISAAVALQACSAVKLAYNNAPELAYWYFDSYVDFTAAQSFYVKEELAGLQAWHRPNQLPGYVATLQNVRQKMLADLNASQACEVFADARSKMIAVTAHAQRAVATLAVMLTPDQLIQMERKFEKGNKKYREDYLEAPAGKSRKKRYEEAVSRAEMLYGRLEHPQLERISFAIDQSGFNARMSYEERLRRQKDISQTVRLVATGIATPGFVNEKAHEEMRALFDRAFSSPNTAYRDYFEKLTQTGCQSFSELHNSTTAVQRNKAVETIVGYEQDLKTLVSK